MTIDPQPTNPFGWLIILLIGAVLFVFGFGSTTTVTVVPESTAQPPRGVRVPPPDGDAQIVPGLPRNANLFAVETFDLIIRESFPPQVTVTVSGYWPDGCSIEPEIITYREDMTIYVQIYRILPPDIMCTQVMQRFSTDITISDLLMDGDTFRFGEYTINVNGAERQANF